MKRKISISIVAILLAGALRAQIHPLPFYNTFDSPQQQGEWTEYRTGFQHIVHWSYNTDNSVTGPSSLHHASPESTDPADSICDWMVSPAIAFDDEAVLMFLSYGYKIGDVQPTDYFGVWFSDSLKDPSDGGYVELMNLTDDAVSQINTWRTSIIDIPYTTPSGYIAFVFKSSVSKYKIYIDDLSVQKVDNTGVPEKEEQELVQLYPNPASDYFTIRKLNETEVGSLELYDLTGRMLRKIQVSQALQRVERSGLPSGTYFYHYTNDFFHSRGKLILR